MTNAPNLHPLQSPAAEVIGSLKLREAPRTIPGGRRPGMTPSCVITGLVPVISIVWSAASFCIGMAGTSPAMTTERLLTHRDTLHSSRLIKAGPIHAEPIDPLAPGSA
jgi:hypothetical protein